MDKYEQCALLIRQAKNILILTGAGMSTESGIPDFRSSNGLYKGEFHGMRPEEILSYTFFRQNPDIFRITSYNVCYTKLLRVVYGVGLSVRDDIRSTITTTSLLTTSDKAYSKVDLNSSTASVITSYSIHYTKLYDT